MSARQFRKGKRSMISVKFTRKKTDLTITAIYVKDQRLTFHDEVAFQLLEPGERCDIHWRIMGNPGGQLIVTKSVNGADEKIVKSAIPAGKDRLSDFTDFTV